jgi:cytochrome c oxidase cbb3-type subunit 3
MVEARNFRRGLAIAVGVLALIGGCKRERREFPAPPSTTNAKPEVQLVELQPGQAKPPPPGKNDEENNALSMNEGRLLYNAFNCVGCHAHGGGSMGPALLDEKWRYGSDPAQIYSTIMEGRPNGMPSFRGRISEHQVWQIVAYVRSLSGLVPKDAAPSREDHMKSSPPPNSVDSVKPRAAEAPQPGR